MFVQRPHRVSRYRTRHQRPPKIWRFSILPRCSLHPSIIIPFLAPTVPSGSDVLPQDTGLIDKLTQPCYTDTQGQHVTACGRPSSPANPQTGNSQLHSHHHSLTGNREDGIFPLGDCDSCVIPT
jgi:hypothetical protein